MWSCQFRCRHTSRARRLRCRQTLPFRCNHPVNGVIDTRGGARHCGLARHRSEPRFRPGAHSHARADDRGASRGRRGGAVLAASPCGAWARRRAASARTHSSCAPWRDASATASRCPTAVSLDGDGRLVHARRGPGPGRRRLVLSAGVSEPRAGRRIAVHLYKRYIPPDQDNAPARPGRRRPECLR